MNNPCLVVRYVPDDEYIGELIATVESRGYSGRGKAYFDRLSVKETFVAALRAFPLSPANLPHLEGGFGSKTEPDTVSECHLRIGVRPYNSQGLLIVQTDLATEVWNNPDQDCQQLISARFLTEYALVATFADELDAILDGTRECATLRGRL